MDYDTREWGEDDPEEDERLREYAENEAIDYERENR